MPLGKRKVWQTVNLYCRERMKAVGVVGRGMGGGGNGVASPHNLSVCPM